MLNTSKYELRLTFLFAAYYSFMTEYFVKYNHNDFEILSRLKPNSNPRLFFSEGHMLASSPPETIALSGRALFFTLTVLPAISGQREWSGVHKSALNPVTLRLHSKSQCFIESGLRSEFYKCLSNVVVELKIDVRPCFVRVLLTGLIRHIAEVSPKVFLRYVGCSLKLLR